VFHGVSISYELIRESKSFRGTTSLRSITENISRTLAAIVMVKSRCREDDSQQETDLGPAVRGASASPPDASTLAGNRQGNVKIPRGFTVAAKSTAGEIERER
jgi:hypothetical protein